MPTPATDRPRLALAAIAIASLALTGLSVRVLDGAGRAASRQVPASDLRNISAYLAPLPDTTSLAVVPVGSMVGESDPFGAPARVSHGSSTATPSGAAAASGSSQQWVVSSILFEDSKRSAILNDAWVSVGDPLAGGARVAAIERKHVVVTDAAGKRQIVPLQGRSP
jgi:hypothetical protein